MVLQASDLTKNYDSLKALDDFNLEVKKGEVWGVLGPNGSGKTTALGILLGVTLPSTGSYQWFDEQPAAFQRRRIGALLEQPNFYPWLTGEQNLKVVAHIRSHLAPADVENKLKLVGLWERRKDQFSKYSLGMKQRLAIAAALLADPEALVLDEPTNGLDAKAIAEIRETIIAVAAQGKTILMASHILDEVEKTCSHVIILQKGKTLARGAIQQVLSAGNQFEFSAENNQLLKAILVGQSICKNLRLVGEHFVAEFTADISAAKFNQMMFEKGITLKHLARQSHGLENQFLKLLEQNRE